MSKVKKIILFFLTLWSVITLLFILFYVVGNPAEAFLGQHSDEEFIRKISESMGWDKPLYIQYFIFIRNIVSFPPDFGVSFYNKQPAFAIYWEHLKGTALLAIPSVLFAFVVGTLAGTFSAYKQGVFSKITDFLASLTIALPSFFVALLFIKIFALKFFPELPVNGYILQPDITTGRLHWDFSYFILPFFTLSIRPLAIIYQLQKQNTMNVLNEDYIRTAYAKGLPEVKILLVHALRNALNPTITSATNWLASLLAGTFFIEYIFQWKGVGNLLVNSLLTRDYPVVIATSVSTAAIFLIILFLTDVLYSLLDPRIR